MIKKFFLILLLLLPLFLAFCGSQDEEIDEVLKYCGTSDLESLFSKDSVSEECKQAVLDFLPQPENDIQNRLVNLGQGVVDQKTILFCSGTDDIGEKLDSGDITAKDQSGETIDSSQYTVKSFGEFSGVLVSFSSVIDYSGSMSDQDIDDAIEIFTDLSQLATLTDKFETNIIIFSDTVKIAMDFSNDTEAINEHIALDSDFERKSTQLLDAMGSGLESLSQRESPIKLLVVATDGRENASEEYEKKDIFELSETNRIPVIILGSLFADLSFLKEVSEETGGFYIYSKKILELIVEFVEIHEMFEKIVGIELSESLSQNLPDSISISVSDEEIIYNF